jgi:hypothetical protein
MLSRLFGRRSENPVFDLMYPPGTLVKVLYHEDQTVPASLNVGIVLGSDARGFYLAHSQPGEGDGFVAWSAVKHVLRGPAAVEARDRIEEMIRTTREIREDAESESPEGGFDSRIAQAIGNAVRAREGNGVPTQVFDLGTISLSGYPNAKCQCPACKEDRGKTVRPEDLPRAGCDCTDCLTKSASGMPRTADFPPHETVGVSDAVTAAADDPTRASDHLAATGT